MNPRFRDDSAARHAGTWGEIPNTMILADEVRTPTAVELARGIEADRAWDRLPILADALEDAGCDDHEMLGHLRAGGPHTDWCWAIDAVLGEHRVRKHELAHMRLRPGMYIGDVDVRGLHRLLFLMVCESLTDARSGHGTSVRVSLGSNNSVRIGDDGVVPEDVFPGLTFECTGRRHQFAPDTRDWIVYTIANSFAEQFDIEYVIAGQKWGQTCTRGKPIDRVRPLGRAARPSGLSVAFRPDPEIFGDARFDPDGIRSRLRQYAYLNSGVELAFIDSESRADARFRYQDGIAAFVRMLVGRRRRVHRNVIVVRGHDQGVRYEVGLVWCAFEADAVIRSFVNGEETTEGGTHVTGFLSAVTRAVNAACKERGQPTLRGEYIREGLIAVVSVWLTEPQYQGAVRNRIRNPEAQSIVQAGVFQALADWLTTSPRETIAILRQAYQASELALTAKQRRAERVSKRPR